MKTAIYIEDGTVQLVITPETEFEKSAIKTLRGKETKLSLFNGSFYDCRGGWVRQTAIHGASPLYNVGENDESLIIRVSEEPQQEEVI